METGNRLELNVVIKQFKLQNGNVNFNQVLRIPSADRLTGLVQSRGYETVHVLLSAGIQVAMESMNLQHPMTANQIIDLSDAIIDSATEDNLSMEDVILFLQRMVRGEAGTLYNSMDIPKFMSMFEKYRQDRHDEVLRVRDEERAQFKTLGSHPRVNGEVEKGDDIDNDTFFDLLQTYYEVKND